jgi:hypothetical protein
MTRRAWLLVAGGVTACRTRVRKPDALRESVAGIWHRTELRDLSAAEAPDPVPRDSIRQIQTASYEGPGELEVHVYEVTAPAIALDLVQRWRAPAGTAYFFFDHVYFVALKWRNANRGDVQAFVDELETRLETAGN